MQLCCMQLLHAIKLHATKLHEKVNIHDATIACNKVSSCMVGLTDTLYFRCMYISFPYLDSTAQLGNIWHD